MVKKRICRGDFMLEKGRWCNWTALGVEALQALISLTNWLSDGQDLAPLFSHRPPTHPFVFVTFSADIFDNISNIITPPRFIRCITFYSKFDHIILPKISLFVKNIFISLLLHFKLYLYSFLSLKFNSNNFSAA
jgi:hypothetical protein